MNGNSESNKILLLAQLKFEKSLLHVRNMEEFTLHLCDLTFFSNIVPFKNKPFTVRRQKFAELLNLLEAEKYGALVGIDEEIITLKYFCRKQNIPCPPCVVTTLDPHFTQLGLIGEQLGAAYKENQAHDIALSDDIFWFYPAKEYRQNFLDYGIRPDNLSYLPYCAFFQKTFSDEFELYTDVSPAETHHVTQAVKGKILAAGNFNRDYITFVKACTGLNAEVYIIANLDTVIITTGGDIRAELQAALDAAPNVHLCNPVPLDVYTDCLRNAGVVVVPLMNDNFVTGHLTISTAQMLGKCVVATDFPTSHDFIEHGLSGLLYEPCNPDSLRKQLSAAVQSEEYARTIGENGRACEARISENARASFLSIVRKAANYTGMER
jgi:glycosyltransferase involved in cell wall biosynthesis